MCSHAENDGLWTFGVSRLWAMDLGPCISC